MANCIQCKADCEKAGTVGEACKKFDKGAGYVIETDNICAFPQVIEVQSTKSNKKIAYVKIS